MQILPLNSVRTGVLYQSNIVTNYLTRNLMINRKIIIYLTDKTRDIPIRDCNPVRPSIRLELQQSGRIRPDWQHAAYLAWAKARTHKAPDERELKKAYNNDNAAKSSRKTIRRARFDHVSRVGAKLASYPAQQSFLGPD